jgi:hypothetical protein
MSDAILLKRRRLVDVAGLEPAAPCLQSWRQETLTCFAGVAYTENQRNSRSPNVPKLYRISELQTLSELYIDYFRFALIHSERLAESSCSPCRLRRTKRCNQPLQLD